MTDLERFLAQGLKCDSFQPHAQEIQYTVRTVLLVTEEEVVRATSRLVFNAAGKLIKWVVL